MDKITEDPTFQELIKEAEERLNAIANSSFSEDVIVSNTLLACELSTKEQINLSYIAAILLAVRAIRQLKDQTSLSC